MIQAFHFGSGAQRLFGAYHEPRTQGAARGGVVLCYPAGHEYIWAHRAFRQLAEQLADAGMHVLRFDYFGAGDSAGESDEVRVKTCVENVATAVDELKDMTGLDSVSLIGLRLGAALAAAASTSRDDIERIVLWDPVVSGRAFLDEVIFLDRRSRNGDAGIVVASESAPLELLGFPMTPQLHADLTGLRLELGGLRARRVLLIVSEDRPEYSALRLGARTWRDAWTFRHVRQNGSWQDMDRLGTALLPREIIAATTSWFTE